MNEFSHHEPCPRCHSRDNLGVWDDGHKFCFGCGYGIRGNRGQSVADLKQHLHQREKNKNVADLHLPSDYSHTIPTEPLNWLRKYGITDKEILTNHIGWSDNVYSLIFSVFDLSGNLCLYQMRNFEINRTSKPRFFTMGFPEMVFHFCGNDSDNRIILCEDYISSICIGRVALAMPLWGSQISINRIRTLSDRFSKLVIWLDRDKQAYSLHTKIRAEPFFNEVQCVFTENDPKCYSNDAITSILGLGPRAVSHKGTGA